MGKTRQHKLNVALRVYLEALETLTDHGLMHRQAFSRPSQVESISEWDRYESERAMLEKAKHAEANLYAAIPLNALYVWFKAEGFEGDTFGVAKTPSKPRQVHIETWRDDMPKDWEETS